MCVCGGSYSPSTPTRPPAAGLRNGGGCAPRQEPGGGTPTWSPRPLGCIPAKLSRSCIPAWFHCPVWSAGKGEALGPRAGAQAENEWLLMQRGTNWTAVGRSAPRAPHLALAPGRLSPRPHSTTRTVPLLEPSWVRTRLRLAGTPSPAPTAPWPRPARPHLSAAPPLPAPPAQPAPALPQSRDLSPAQTAESALVSRSDARRPQCPLRPPRPGRDGAARVNITPGRLQPLSEPSSSCRGPGAHRDGEDDGGAAVAASAAAARRR